MKYKIVIGTVVAAFVFVCWSAHVALNRVHAEVLPPPSNQYPIYVSGAMVDGKHREMIEAINRNTKAIEQLGVLCGAQANPYLEKGPGR